jgi:hypothetical protein
LPRIFIKDLEEEEGCLCPASKIGDLNGNGVKLNIRNLVWQLLNL